jgi:hypothetical protein
MQPQYLLTNLFSALFVIIVFSLVASYIAINGPTFSNIKSTIINQDPQERVANIYIPRIQGSIQLKPDETSQSISLKPGDIIRAEFVGDDSDVIRYHVGNSSDNSKLSLFDKAIVNNTNTFDLAVYNISSLDIVIWNKGLKVCPSLSLNTVKVGGTVNIPVYTNQELRFVPVGLDYNDAKLIMMVQSKSQGLTKVQVKDKELFISAK